MIIDTDVIIWELRGNVSARQVIHSNIPFNISVVTYIELVQGMRNKQELNKFIKQMAKWNVDIIQINNDISTRAMIYVEEFFLSHSIALADALIAATCINNSEILLTANDKHYRHIPNIQLMKFEPIISPTPSST
ncbi:MAG: PIN domain-containing protein [Desulfosalsimonadaceae bacterium]|nr:PIN domain-containing protein [Desulfosalsimonadaceae bacterium]